MDGVVESGVVDAAAVVADRVPSGWETANPFFLPLPMSTVSGKTFGSTSIGRRSHQGQRPAAVRPLRRRRREQFLEPFQLR